jgi:regulator of Ty1 transposition protein 103
VKTKVGKANEEFTKMTDPSLPVPTPPVHAARLSALGKLLASAQGAVEASLKARTNLVSELEDLITKHRTQLESEETLFADLKSKREGTEAKKNEVEDGIMRGLSTPSSPDIPTPTNVSNSSFLPNPNGNGNDSTDERRELDRPEAEDFTPPPEDRDIIEAVDDLPTDPRMRQARSSFTSTTGAEAIQELPPNFNEPPPAFEPPPAMSPRGPGSVDPSNAAAAAEQFLSNLSASGLGQVRQASQEIPNGSTDPRLKRRKLSHQNPVRRGSEMEGEEEFATTFDAGVDEEGISALLQ